MIISIIYLYFYPKITIICKICVLVLHKPLLHTQSFNAFKSVEKHDFPRFGSISSYPCSNTESVRRFRNDPCGMMEKSRCHFSRCDKLLVVAAERNMMFRQKSHVQPCCFMVETIELNFWEAHRSIFQKTSLPSYPASKYRIILISHS